MNDKTEAIHKEINKAVSSGSTPPEAVTILARAKRVMEELEADAVDADKMAESFMAAAYDMRSQLKLETIRAERAEAELRSKEKKDMVLSVLAHTRTFVLGAVSVIAVLKFAL